MQVHILCKHGVLHNCILHEVHLQLPTIHCTRFWPKHAEERLVWLCKAQQLELHGAVCALTSCSSQLKFSEAYRVSLHRVARVILGHALLVLLVMHHVCLEVPEAFMEAITFSLQQ